MQLWQVSKGDRLDVANGSSAASMNRIASSSSSSASGLAYDTARSRTGSLSDHDDADSPDVGNRTNGINSQSESNANAHNRLPVLIENVQEYRALTPYGELEEGELLEEVPPVGMTQTIIRSSRDDLNQYPIHPTTDTVYLAAASPSLNERLKPHLLPNGRAPATISGMYHKPEHLYVGGGNGNSALSPGPHSLHKRSSQSLTSTSRSMSPTLSAAQRFVTGNTRVGETSRSRHIAHDRTGSLVVQNPSNSSATVHSYVSHSALAHTSRADIRYTRSQDGRPRERHEYRTSTPDLRRQYVQQHAKATSVDDTSASASISAALNGSLRDQTSSSRYGPRSSATVASRRSNAKSTGSRSPIDKTSDISFQEDAPASSDPHTQVANAATSSGRGGMQQSALRQLPAAQHGRASVDLYGPTTSQRSRFPLSANAVDTVTERVRSYGSPTRRVRRSIQSGDGE